MDSHGLLLFLLWLALAVGIILFVRWLSHFLSKFKLPNDTRLLILIAFTGTLVIAALNFLWKQGDKQPAPPVTTDGTASTQPPKTGLDLDTYESTTYPALYGLRQDMLKQIADLHTFFGNVRQWAEHMPGQRRFLQTIIDIRWEQQQQLRKAYQEIDRSRRAFWLHYHTGEDRHVRKMFDEEALRLQKRIQNALGDSRAFQLEEADAIREHLRKAGENLKAATLPKPKKGQTRADQFAPYSDHNRQVLLETLTRKQENSILPNLNKLQQEEAQIRSKLAYMLEYQKVNTDLQQEVNQLILAWNDALIYNQYAQYRLLFATETLETALLLNTLPDNRDYAWLLKQLRELAPTVLAQAEAERDVAAYSYNPDIEQRYRKPR
ncbi:hypothetical protein SAMN05660964_00707 [Thiothrix caldifontis]|uniref:Uncharacterized protein n=1 Tax=Thiothrix caldifontis TaxID=525918 RepID=A0A1H3XJT2_9GAMM|nr:hypothetical protein [Thiothrix caldifontis]SDZ99191.1 hypothetical protein SAMN05660964_00707 [Thiothrix caldifontis]